MIADRSITSIIIIIVIHIIYMLLLISLSYTHTCVPAATPNLFPPRNIIVFLYIINNSYITRSNNNNNTVLFSMCSHFGFLCVPAR